MNEQVTQPPRLILGASLLFWGAMVAHPFLGLVLALIVEGANWTRLRWDFDEKSGYNAWRLTFLLGLAGLVMSWMDGKRADVFSSLMVWLPVLFLPLQFVQSYGEWKAMPMTVFSSLASRQHRRNVELGFDDDVQSFNAGFAYFASVLVAAALGAQSTNQSWLFLPILVVLCIWMLVATYRRWWLGYLVLCAVAGVLAYAGQLGIRQLEQRLGYGGKTSGAGFNPYDESTKIGKVGKVTLSPKIVWRMKPSEGQRAPKYLRLATYDSFIGSRWRNQEVSDDDFKELPTILMGELSYYLAVPAEQAEALRGQPRFSLRGSVVEGSPMPLPGDVAGLQGFALFGIEANRLGVVVVDPMNSVIEGEVFWQWPTAMLEAPPDVGESGADLRVPIPLRVSGGVAKVADELGLAKDVPLQQKLTVLKKWYVKNFRYTLDLKVQGRTGEDGLWTPPLDDFLLNTRAGHCEYFATASVLLLRQAGIPARYATGFVVTERRPNGEFIMRENHGHAWCRVWDAQAQSWIDFDPTPGGSEAGGLFAKAPLSQRLADWWQLVREDFFLWRNRPKNKLGVNIVIGLLVFGMTTFIGRRLWRSRKRHAHDGHTRAGQDEVRMTPLHELEKDARKLLGPRQPGETYVQWLGGLSTILDDHESLQQAIALHQKLRFDPAPVDEEEMQTLAMLTEKLRAEVQASRDRAARG